MARIESAKCASSFNTGKITLIPGEAGNEAFGDVITPLRYRPSSLTP